MNRTPRLLALNCSLLVLLAVSASGASVNLAHAIVPILSLMKNESLMRALDAPAVTESRSQ